MKNKCRLRPIVGNQTAFLPIPTKEVPMVRKDIFSSGHMFLKLLAVSFAMLCVVDALGADPIFDDDDAPASVKQKEAPTADADMPANVQAVPVPVEIADALAPVNPGAPTQPKEAEKPAAVKVAAQVVEPADAIKPENGDTAPIAVAEKKDTPADPAKPAATTDKPAGDKPVAENKPAETKPAEPVTLEPEKDGIAAAKVAKAEKAKENLGQRRDTEVGRNEELGFLQSKVTSQMLELEERMYRLSEALKTLEPENASRLLIGLKYAREELIQLQMKEIQSALTSRNFRDAVVEQKLVLAKLQRLEQLLLSPDLDFQLQLERLRLMRELIKRLDAAIAEEEREKAATEQTVMKENQLEELKERKTTLKELIALQTGHVKSGRALTAPADAQRADNAESTAASPKSDDVPQPETIEALAEGQGKTRELTTPLEKLAPEVAQAGGEMEQAVQNLKDVKAESAVTHQSAALDSLKKALDSLEASEKKLEKALAEEKFNAMRKDQANNRKTTEGISEMAVQLGDAGAAARAELIRAGGSMSSAEQSFGGRNASSADTAQGEAIASLKYARELLEAEAEKLANRLRAEVKKRTLEGMAQMLEGQIAVRESTERLGPKAKDGGQAISKLIAGLATAEGKLITIGEGLTSLIEETEFGIALPAALRSITDAMIDVRERLAGADASEGTIVAEKLIEEDLQELINAMKQLPSQSDGKGRRGNGGGNGRRERELNRLIAELRIVRMLQVRVNRDTKDVDGHRPEEIKDLTATIKHRIEAIHDRQDDIHDVTEAITLERLEELQQ